MGKQFSPLGHKLLQGEPRRVADERKAVLRAGKVGRPMKPSGNPKTVIWKYGNKKAAAKAAKQQEKGKK